MAAPPEEGGVDYAVRDFEAENYPRVLFACLGRVQGSLLRRQNLLIHRRSKVKTSGFCMIFSKTDVFKVILKVANRSVGGRISGKGGMIRSEGRFGSKTNRASDDASEMIWIRRSVPVGKFYKDRHGKIRRIIDYEYGYELVPRFEYLADYEN
ncbi:hypothetical protein CEXT_204601 [Caerostris extrusa]|uniref:Uncharacterized protein n=1 Tax=Caerostris extrusa TaxID=172846 RepID=A0AAV4MUD1_CAEEX|nr:hypothetical protein CEXT_204601 [Caerostris extrusa]